MSNYYHLNDIVLLVELAKADMKGESYLEVRKGLGAASVRLRDKGLIDLNPQAKQTQARINADGTEFLQDVVGQINEYQGPDGEESKL